MKRVTPISETQPAPAAAQSFATTQWSAVLAAAGDTSTAARSALEELCAAYWYPLYAYVRRRGHGVHDAQDLTQGFFVHLLEHDGIKYADPARGRFRTYLLSSLNNFLKNDWKKGNRQKRGNGHQPLSFDSESAETRFAHEPAVAQPEDTLYDRLWASILLDLALTKLRAEFSQAGKLDHFDRFKSFVWGERSALSYSAIAAQLNMTEGGVKTTVHRLRRRFGELLQAEVSRTVSSPTEVNEELRYLISVMRDGLANQL